MKRTAFIYDARMNFPSSQNGVMRQRVSTHQGFTLIELLVVVAIIAVLVAILLPSLSSARSRAQETACLANLHQWANVLQSYRNDHNDFLVPQYGPNWDQVLVDGNYLTKDTKIAGCAGNRAPIINGMAANATYVPNAYLWAQHPYPGLKSLNGNTRWINSEPADVVVLAEREHIFLNSACGNAFHHGMYDGSDVSFLHRGSGCFLFLDGHASWVERTGSYENYSWMPNPDPTGVSLYLKHWNVVDPNFPG